MKDIDQKSKNSAGGEDTPSAGLLARLKQRLSGFTKKDGNTEAKAGLIALIAFAVRVGSAGLAYLMHILMARWMGAEEYGIYIAVWVTLLVLGVFAAIGLPSVTTRFIPIYQHEQDKERLRGLLLAARGTVLFFSSLISALGLLVLNVAPDLFANPYLTPLFLATFCLPLMVLTFAYEGIARGFDWPLLMLLPTYLVRPLLILLFMAIAVFAFEQNSAAAALSSALLACFLTVAGQIILVGRKVREEVKAPRAKMEWKLWLGAAFPILFAEAFFELLLNIDVLTVGYLMTPGDVALYFAAVKTLALAHFVQYAVRSAAMRRISAYKAANMEERLSTFISTTVHWTFWPTLLLVGILLLLGKPLLWLFGPEFTSAYSAMAVLALGVIIRASVGPAETALMMLGHQNRPAIIFTGALIINVAANFLLIPLYGIMGAAIATTLSMVFQTVALYFSVRVALGYTMFIGHIPPAGSKNGESVSLEGKYTFQLKTDWRSPEFQSEWQSLTENAHRPNVFWGADFCIPAAKGLADGTISLGTLRDAATGKLIALAPVQTKKLFKIGPSYFELWAHEFGPLGQILVDRNDKSAEQTLVECLVENAPGKMLFAPYTPFANNLAEKIEGLSMIIAHIHERAAIVVDTDHSQYPSKKLSASRAKTLRRQMRKLSSFFNGADIEIDLHSERETVLASFEEFLRIEALGWKGKRKTALIQTDKHSDFARQTIEKLALKGQVRAATLKVENRVLAVVIFLIEGDHAFAWKTAFDELYSGFSPGAILLHLAPEKLFQQDEIKLLDSLAHPQNKLINSLWSDRLSHAYLGYCRPRAAPMVHTILALFNVEKQLRKVAHALRPKPY